MSLLTRKEQDSFIFKARKCLHDTAGDPVAYNAEEFVSFSRFILDELLEAQLSKVHRPDRQKVAKKLAELEEFTWAWIVENKFEDEWLEKADQIYALFDEEGKTIVPPEILETTIMMRVNEAVKDEREKIIKWGKEHCNHHSNSYGPRHRCSKCWQNLKEGK